MILGYHIILHGYQSSMSCQRRLGDDDRNCLLVEVVDRAGIGGGGAVALVAGVTADTIDATERLSPPLFPPPPPSCVLLPAVTAAAAYPSPRRRRRLRRAGDDATAPPAAFPPVPVFFSSSPPPPLLPLSSSPLPSSSVVT